MDIGCFDDYVVNRISVMDEKNRHSVCIVDLTVENEKIQCFLSDNQVGNKSISVGLDGEIVFSGTIRRIDSVKTYLITKVRITAISFSDILDSEIHNRVFQSPKKTYEKICSFFSDNKVEVKCVDESINDEQIENILLQHNETDFEFLRRIFQSKKQDIYIVNNRKSCCSVEIVEKRNFIKETIAESDIVRFSQEKYENYERVKICTYKLFEVGAYVEVFGTTYQVESREIINEYEKNEIQYSLIIIVEQKNNPLLDSFNLGLAKVVNNSSDDHLGKIQVEFLEYEDAMGEEKIWIDYLSPLTEKGGGFIALPDQNEVVEVIYRNNKCVAIGCVRVTELDEHIQDTNKRYFCSRGCSITTDDKYIDILVDKNNIRITESEMSLSNGKFDVVISEEQCKIGYENTKILMDKDTFQILGKAEIDMQSNNINLEGRNSVKAKTKSFDIG